MNIDSGEVNMSNILYYLAFTMISILFVFFLFMLIGWRWLMKRIVKQMWKIILTDSYQENIMELIPGLRHMGFQNVLQKNGRIWIRLPLSLHRQHRFQLMVKKK